MHEKLEVLTARVIAQGEGERGKVTFINNLKSINPCRICPMPNIHRVSNNARSIIVGTGMEPVLVLFILMNLSVGSQGISSLDLILPRETIPDGAELLHTLTKRANLTTFQNIIQLRVNLHIGETKVLVQG
mmetsp:Transcript_6451/g.8884  ORF Transcript_6451/g.8884 Transcript_6451/m.8884 type:complete len:131 (-) Transcript_6451:1495-1887(-)